MQIWLQCDDGTQMLHSNLYLLHFVALWCDDEFNEPTICYLFGECFFSTESVKFVRAGIVITYTFVALSSNDVFSKATIGYLIDY
jgi:hypothetical protein